MERSELIRKLSIYGGNFLARPIGNSIKAGLDLANPWGAITFGVLDILRSKSLAVRDNPYVRLLQSGGLVFYGTSTISNLVSIAKGDYSALGELPFNASMAFEIGKNTLEDYSDFGGTPLSDAEDVKDDAINLKNYLPAWLRNLFQTR